MCRLMPVSITRMFPYGFVFPACAAGVDLTGF